MKLSYMHREDHFNTPSWRVIFIEAKTRQITNQKKMNEMTETRLNTSFSKQTIYRKKNKELEPPRVMIMS